MKDQNKKSKTVNQPFISPYVRLLTILSPTCLQLGTAIVGTCNYLKKETKYFLKTYWKTDKIG